MSKRTETSDAALLAESSNKDSSFGGGDLPDRIRARIVASDEESERLIGWVQLALASTLGVLYAIAPKPADAEMGRLAPVPFVLALYACFTVGRIVLSRRGRLGVPAVCLSIVIDVVLLLGLIWMIHIQYAQPAAFSLKVPTFVYVFVVIALRALRFDPRYVVLVGATAALGWFGLTAVAIMVSEPGVVTRSFSDYLTRNAILIGAELDKILAILTVTGVLSLGLTRARRILISAVREGAAVREVSRFLSDGVARAIADAPQEVAAGRGVARDAAILMLDLRGFSRLTASLEPEAVVTSLIGVHADIVPIVRRHGGVIDKFMGDGVMATFGAVVPSATAAADALRALEDVIDQAGGRLSKFGSASSSLELNGAVTAGSVIFAAIGTADRLEYTVIGSAVNLAAKLEKHNKVLRSRALTTRTTYQLALVQGYRPSEAESTMCGSGIAGLDEHIDLVVIREARS